MRELGDDGSKKKDTMVAGLADWILLALTSSPYTCKCYHCLVIAARREGTRIRRSFPHDNSTDTSKQWIHVYTLLRSKTVCRSVRNILAYRALHIRCTVHFLIPAVLTVAGSFRVLTCSTIGSSLRGPINQCLARGDLGGDHVQAKVTVSAN